MPAEMLWRIYRVQMFELGHSMQEIDNMNLRDIGDVIGYWTEKDRADSKLKKEQEDLG